MLLATFQPVYDKTEAREGKHLRSQGKFPEAGFDVPVWCCPADDLTDLFVSARFAAPRFPDEFIILETDNFRRVDKVGWYRCVHDGLPFNEDLLDPDLPDVECEFLTDLSEVMMKYKCRVYTLQLRAMLEAGKFPVIFSEDFGTFDDVVLNRCMDRARSLLRMYSFGSIGSNNPEWEKFSAAQIAYKTEAAICRQVFLYTLMPYIWAMVSRQSDPGSFVDVSYFGADAAERVYAKFVDWAELDDSVCDWETYKMLAEEMASCLLSNEGWRVYLKHADRLPGVNDRCPCGSGRKFKKCCMRYL